MYQAFYNIIRITDVVDAESPIQVTLSDVTNDLLPLMKEDGEYIGLIDSNGTVFQFMYNGEEDTFWGEVTSPERGGSYGKNFEYDEFRNFIDDLPSTFPKKGFEGFNFNSWTG